MGWLTLKLSFSFNRFRFTNSLVVIMNAGLIFCLLQYRKLKVNHVLCIHTKILWPGSVGVLQQRTCSVAFMVAMLHFTYASVIMSNKSNNCSLFASQACLRPACARVGPRLAECKGHRHGKSFPFM